MTEKAPFMARFHHSRRIVQLCIALFVLALPVRAEDMPALQVLRGSGAPVVTSLEVLESAPQISFTTSTIWTDSENEFSGVSLKALLKMYDVTSGEVELIALNDYSIVVPVDELDDDAPIVASRVDGARISVRDRGPLWVVYPYDKDPRFQTETVFSRSIWQLNRIRIIE